MVRFDTKRIYQLASEGGSLSKFQRQINFRDEYGQTALMHAVNDPKIGALKQLLSAGADPNITRNKTQYITALTIAVTRGRYEHIKELIRAGAFLTCERGLFVLQMAKGSNLLDDVLIGDEVMKTRPNFSKENNAFHVSYKNNCFDLLLELINYGVTTSITSIELSDLARADLFNALINSAKTDIDEQDDKGQTTLMRAVQQNKTQIVQSLIQKGARLDVVNLKGETALHIACRGQVDMVKILLEAGAKTEVYNKNNLTPLAVATRSSNIEIMTIMLAAGADINCRGNKGETLLMMTIRAYGEGIVKFVLNNQININAVDDDLNTALHIACDLRSFYVYTLIQAGAKLDVYNAKSKTPFCLAFEQGDEYTMELLAQAGADINCQDENQRTPLVNAVINSDVNMTIFLIRLGANVNYVDNQGKSALIWAVINTNENFVEMLLHFKADVNCVDHKNRSALFHAAGTSNTKIISDLIKTGALVNVTSKHSLKLPELDSTSDLLKDAQEYVACPSEERVSVLHFAVSNLSALAVSLLLEAGADVNAVDDHGRTPIHIAAAKGSLEIVESLRQFGADVNVVDKYGNSPLFVSILFNHKEVTKYLLECGADVNLICDSLCSPLFVDVLLNDKELVKLLIQLGALVDKGNDSELLAALENQNIDLVNILLDKGADVNAKDRNQTPSLILALRSCLNSNMLTVISEMNVLETQKPDHSIESIHTKLNSTEDVSEYSQYGRPTRKDLLDEEKVTKSKALTMSLISHDARVSDRDNEGNTCLHVAVQYCGREVLEMLIDLKAYVDVQNNNGETPLMKACQYGNVEAVYFLVTLGADVMLTDQNKDTALHHLVRFVEEEVTGVDVLLKSANQISKLNHYEADTTEMSLNQLTVAKNRYGESVLSVACRNGHLKIVQILVLEQYNLNEINDFGDTTLIISIKSKHDIIAKFLLDLKANLHVQDKNGETALHIAVKHSMEETVQHLIQNGAYVNVTNNNGDTPIHFASTVTIVKFLLDAKSDLNILNQKGQTALHSSIKRNNDLVASFLIENGAGLDFVTSTGKTALMYAADIQNFTLIQLLVERGANVNIQDSEGRTALMHVVLSKIARWTSYGPKDTEEICEYLQAKGADLNKTNYKGETVCMMAVQKGSSQVLEKLVLLGADLNILDKENKSVLVHSLLSSNGRTSKKSLNKFLQLGFNPVVNESYRYLVKELYFKFSFGVKMQTFHNLIANNHLHLFQFFLANGFIFRHYVSTFKSKGNYCDFSSFCCVLSHELSHIVNFFFATGFLFNTDMQSLRQIKRSSRLRYQQNLFGYHNRSREKQDYRRPLPKLPVELQSALNEPWPLVKLAFIEVSTLLGTGPMRHTKLKKTKLPPRLQRTLMFQEPISRLPVEDWSKIPLCFDPVQYETLPCPRPLLYYWPVGHRLVN